MNQLKIAFHFFTGKKLMMQSLSALGKGRAAR